ncbi:hypothetical protein EVG20_g11608 [Dentipellis fragilis]|uniref:Dynein light intermediate chain n=1 Tax=Dentipellis fragilis TaxID=205917 RepID=A0A4Y9XKS6_9AGAM|nr:hypothetical protein EVG20_g11608 [Dentipellis fragilis]
METQKARGSILFASRVADQFVKIAAEQSTETLTNEDMADMHSKVVETALNLAQAIPDGRTSVVVNGLAADTARLACQTFDDAKDTTAMAGEESKEITDEEKASDCTFRPLHRDAHLYNPKTSTESRSVAFTNNMDGGSRSSTPEAPPQDLWSSILDSISSTRSIPSKQILLLGQPSSGKSTLASALLQKPAADGGKDEPRTDFALGYDWADVRDDADEDTLARLSVYTVPSSAPSYTSLLPHFVPPRQSLPHTLIVIVLDWTRPWTFVEELHTWLSWIEGWVKGDDARELVITREENRERLQAHLQHYAEPTADPTPATSSMQGTILPLGPGTFTHNTAGVPIIVTCTKADLIDDNNDLVAGASGMGGMVKGKGGEWEERTDGIMQVLRTICLKYGAGLFYTTQQPATLQVLRHYALHLLFIPPAPSPGLSSPTEPTAPARNPFPFQHKPNTLDRDRIVVPAGWDSWGKIVVLREGFDAKGWGEAWERDLESAEGDDADEPGAKRMYISLVPDQGAKVQFSILLRFVCGADTYKT